MEYVKKGVMTELFSLSVLRALKKTRLLPNEA